MKKKWEGVQMSADYKGDTWTSSLTLANPDIVNGSGVGVLHYLKSVSEKSREMLKDNIWMLSFDNYFKEIVTYSGAHISWHK